MIIDEGGGGQRPDFLFREYGASAVVFHGSRLFGDPYPDSDIDLLVVKESEKKPMARTAEAETLLSRIAAPVPFDVQVWTPEEVRGGVAEGQTYVGIALQNGRYLHGKKERYATEEYFYNIRSWLEEARRHLDYGHLSLEKGSNIGGMDELFQSVERSLKAYLMTKALQVEMTHSLPGLSRPGRGVRTLQGVSSETPGGRLRVGRACHSPPRRPGEVRVVDACRSRGALREARSGASGDRSGACALRRKLGPGPESG